MDKETMEMFSKMLDSKLGALENTLDSKLGALENRLDSKLGALENRLDSKLVAMDNRLDKNTMLLEDLTSKVETMAEVQKLHMEQNEKAHNDIMKNFSEKIEVIELAIKDTSKDVKEIKNGLINVEIINNERDLLMMKKKLSQ
ncbi:hypothetical protein [Clostridium sp.]